MPTLRLHPIPKRTGHLAIEVVTEQKSTRIGTARLNPSGRYTCQFNAHYFRKLRAQEYVLDDDALYQVCVDHCTLFAKKPAHV